MLPSGQQVRPAAPHYGAGGSSLGTGTEGTNSGHGVVLISLEKNNCVISLKSVDILMAQCKTSCCYNKLALWQLLVSVSWYECSLCLCFSHACVQMAWWVSYKSALWTPSTLMRSPAPSRACRPTARASWPIWQETAWLFLRASHWGKIGINSLWTGDAISMA